MERLEVTTGWSLERKPQVAVDYLYGSPGAWECHDATGQPAANIPTDPNLFNVIVVCDAAVADAIEADPNYVVWWRETVVEVTV